MSLISFLSQTIKLITNSDMSTSPEQQQFADSAVQIFEGALSDKGFVLSKTDVKKNSATIVFEKGSQYIKIISSTYPTDYPYFYILILGDGNSHDFPEYDWNSVALWRLKQELEPSAKAKDYSFPVGDKIPFSLTHAREELIKYGATFLNGDLTLFKKVRGQQNQSREPYKIHQPDKNGKYHTTYDPKSEELKKKYS